MVKPYRYDKTNDGFSVIEKPTNYVIKVVDTKEEAKKITNQLNGGVGFNGWTPEFVLRKPKT